MRLLIRTRRVWGWRLCSQPRLSDVGRIHGRRLRMATLLLWDLREWWCCRRFACQTASFWMCIYTTMLQRSCMTAGLVSRLLGFETVYACLQTGKDAQNTLGHSWNCRLRCKLSFHLPHYVLCTLYTYNPSPSADRLHLILSSNIIKSHQTSRSKEANGRPRPAASESSWGYLETMNRR